MIFHGCSQFCPKDFLEVFFIVIMYHLTPPGVLMSFHVAAVFVGGFSNLVFEVETFSTVKRTSDVEA